MFTSAKAVLLGLKQFRQRPWSISRAVIAGISSGAVGAFLHVLLYRVGPFELTYICYVVPAVFWTSAGIVTWFLYRQVERTQFRSDTGAILNSVLALALFVLGICVEVWCYWHHICMDGHMAHPPYPAWHYFLDTAWCASLVAAVIWAWGVRSVLCLGLAAFAAFLVSFRFLLGSAGGTYGSFPL